MNRSTACVVLAGLLVTVGAGCSDEDDDDVGLAPSTRVEEAADGDRSADVDQYCDANLALDLAFAQLGEPTPESLATLAPDVEELITLAPGEISAETEVIAEIFRAAIEGDFSGFESEEFVEANASAHEFDLANCDFTPVPLIAADYEYTGDLPTTPGVYSLEASNTGEEAHLFVVARLKDGEEGTAEEVVASIGDGPDADAAFREHFDELGGTFVVPGSSDYTLLDLEAGQYILLCPLAIGSTPESGFEGDGPPHFTQGMIEFFEIG